MSTIQFTSLASQKLIKRDEDLTPQFLQLADNVYTAVNYSVSCVSMIETENGIIIIDAGQDPADCYAINDEFRKITQKPLLAVIYTHGHPDHTMGTPAFLPNGNNDDKKVQIWARDNFNAENRQFAMLAQIFQARGSRQGGFLLPKELRINNGIAPVRFPKAGGFNAKAEMVRPTNTFSEDIHILNIDGVELELHKATGETADQIFVWYKDKQVLFSGDNLYRSFPNLYAVRGSGYRDVREWIESINKMINLNPQKIVLGHTLPCTSQEESMQVMTDIRDAIKFVYDKTIEGMNNGLTMDEIGEYVQLPTELANKDYLGEYYGNVAWSAKAIFAGHLGWFDGNARTLMPLKLVDEAQRMADLVGGKDALLEKAKEALAKNTLEDAKWAAQLSDYCLYLGMPAENIKADALDIMAEQQLTATGRNYIFTQAIQLRNKAQSNK